MKTGAYVLVFKIAEPVLIEVGRKRKKRWTLHGTYAYVGSAMNNLEKRIERHLRKEKKKHWHIDHALEHGTPVCVLLVESDSRIEEQVSRILARYFGAVPGFGASDVNVKSNLYMIDSLERMITVVSAQFPTVNIVKL